jgi:hypothetical protein
LVANIKTHQLSKAIMDELLTYTGDVVEGMNAAGDELTRDAVKTLKATSPKGSTGKYSKGWRVKKVAFFRTPTRYTIHNKDRYRLAHLIEKGYAKAGGTGRVAGRPHIKPVEEELIAKYMERTERVIKGGG